MFPPSTVPTENPLASTKVTASPEELIATVPTFVVASVKLTVSPATMPKFVTTTPPSVPVTVLSVRMTNVVTVWEAVVRSTSAPNVTAEAKRGVDFQYRR